MAELNDGLMTANLVDIGGPTPRLWAYVFASVTGTVTLEGIFIDQNGRQIGNSVTGSVTTTPAAFGSILALPAPATEMGEDVATSQAACFFGRLGRGSLAL